MTPHCTSKNTAQGKAWSWLGNCALAVQQINLIDFLDIVPVGRVESGFRTFAKFGLLFLAELSKLGAQCASQHRLLGWSFMAKVTKSSLTETSPYRPAWDVACGAGSCDCANCCCRDQGFQERWMAASPCWGLGFGSLQAHFLCKQMPQLFWDRSCFVLGRIPASCKPTLVQIYFTLLSAAGIEAYKIFHTHDTSQNSTVPRQQWWSESNKVLLSFHLLPRLTCLCTSRSTRDKRWSLNIAILGFLQCGDRESEIALQVWSAVYRGSLSYPLYVPWKQLQGFSDTSPVKKDLHEPGILSGEIVGLQLLDYWDLKVTALCHLQGNSLWKCNMALIYDLDVTKH